ncbi:glycosyltransferase [Mariniflexile sp. AS56]|uniref:glycosyltransferase n=1 Tax=Mariniflexile sp. AS56 TaxID=3063957 RepID=UPI0026EFD22F|nr:glycosyltransferase [Mariniflexile sp. AS56]MDO7172724.1 glycosyltransferase [Mariniflexile sp. AS56]
MNQITVSIFLLTYNQEHFIAQTIESILMQKTNFNFQIVIGEDCSTDSTRAICETYANKHSNKIKLLPALEKNIGLIANYMRTIKACDGKYIAICDGDDYWIDEDKLQKQVDFLEENSDYSIVYSKLQKLFPDGTFRESVAKHSRLSNGFDDLIFENVIPSVTALFRNKQNSGDLPSWILNFPYGDWPTYLWTLKDGSKIHFINDVTAVYRMQIGVSAKVRKSGSNTLLVNLGVLKSIWKDPDFYHKKSIVLKAIQKHELGLMTSYNREKKYLKALRQYIFNLKHETLNFKLTKLYLYSIYKSVA